MWTYDQKTGELRHDNKLVATGYSGRGEGRNNPEMQETPRVGPIPRGKYEIGPKMANYPPHGPVVMRLTPQGHDCCGRAGFLIHGDNVRHDASEGCIILPLATRMKIAGSIDRTLEVV